METTKNELKLLGQDQVLKFYDELSDGHKLQFEKELKDIDWKKLNSVYEEQVLSQMTDDHKVRPSSKIADDMLNELPSNCIEGTTICDEGALENYKTEGLRNIGQGKVAALLLAGGQGTRLGVDYPKGMYDVGIGKSLYQLQAERILEKVAGQQAQIIWYIMTSEATMDMTRNFFAEQNYFGLDKNHIVFFEQNTLPCFDFNGKVFLSEKHKISRSPDGNGGLYEALHQKGIIEHMIENGVEYVHVYCVDNILVRVCDPSFMGYCISKKVDTGAKVVEKVNPNEAVGIICKVNDQFKVIEYSEISDNIAQRRDETNGKLVFRAGNICEHFFTVDFLRSIKEDRALPYHIAVKKIPHVCLETGEHVKPTQPNGIKLEKFIFDVFEFTGRFAAWEVIREDEFSPLKNAIGTEKDNPATALEALMRAYKLGKLSC